MSKPAIALFCMPGRGHFHRLRPLIVEFSRSGVSARVYTHRVFQAEIEEAGGTFADLFAHGSIEEADQESWPLTIRFVTFAAQFAERICRDVEAYGPSLVVADTSAVIARVVSKMLRIPYLNVCAGHNVAPAPFVALMEGYPGVKVSRRCVDAVAILKNRYGLQDASPFSYASGLSEHLNIYCEPPAFLDEDEREVFQPIAFYGSLPAAEALDLPCGDARYFAASADEARLKVYLSFGTVIWTSREKEAMAALHAFLDGLDRLGDTTALISLGEANVHRHVREALSRPGVSVETFVNQWRVLQEADVFVTHHGLNSTHEAIFHRVPMVSYPFVWDQPGLARKCQRFGLAVPVVDAPMAPVTPADADRALRIVQRDRAQMLAALATASAWERQVVAERPHVIARILDLAR
jgi:UDP:flavonoid glycosyltransferase YjiC (YdhE family)